MCMSCAVGVPLPLKTAVGIPLCSAASPHADALVLYSLRPLKQCPLTTNLLTHLQLLATAADVCSVDAEASAPDSPGPRPVAARLRCDSLPVAAVAAGADGGDGGARGGVGSSEGGGAAQGGDTRASFKRALSLGASLDTRGRRRSRQLRLRRESRLGDAEAVRGCRLDDFDCVIAGIAHAESAPVATRLLLRRLGRRAVSSHSPPSCLRRPRWCAPARRRCRAAAQRRRRSEAGAWEAGAWEAGAWEAGAWEGTWGEEAATSPRPPRRPRAACRLRRRARRRRPAAARGRGFARGARTTSAPTRS